MKAFLLLLCFLLANSGQTEAFGEIKLVNKTQFNIYFGLSKDQDHYARGWYKIAPNAAHSIDDQDYSDYLLFVWIPPTANSDGYVWTRLNYITSWQATEDIEAGSKNTDTHSQFNACMKLQVATEPTGQWTTERWPVNLSNRDASTCKNMDASLVSVFAIGGLGTHYLETYNIDLSGTYRLSALDPLLNTPKSSLDRLKEDVQETEKALLEAENLEQECSEEQLKDLLGANLRKIDLSPFLSCPGVKERAEQIDQLKSDIDKSLNLAFEAIGNVTKNFNLRLNFLPGFDSGIHFDEFHELDFSATCRDLASCDVLHESKFDDCLFIGQDCIYSGLSKVHSSNIEIATSLAKRAHFYLSTVCWGETMFFQKSNVFDEDLKYGADFILSAYAFDRKIATEEKIKFLDAEGFSEDLPNSPDFTEFKRIFPPNCLTATSEKKWLCRIKDSMNSMDRANIVALDDELKKFAVRLDAAFAIINALKDEERELKKASAASGTFSSAKTDEITAKTLEAINRVIADQERAWQEFTSFTATIVDLSPFGSFKAICALVTNMSDCDDRKSGDASNFERANGLLSLISGPFFTYSAKSVAIFWSACKKIWGYIGPCFR